MKHLYNIMSDTLRGDIELLAAATMLQTPVYTYTPLQDPREYRWSRYSLAKLNVTCPQYQKACS